MLKDLLKLCLFQKEIDWEEDEEYNYEDINVKPEFSDLLSLEQAELDVKVKYTHIYEKRDRQIDLENCIILSSLILIHRARN